VALHIVAHKVHAGGRLRVAQDRGGVHVFALPQIHQAVAPAVGPQTTQVRHFGARPCSGNGGVAGVATKALQIHKGFTRRLARGLVELDHGFAQGHNVEGFGEVCHANKSKKYSAHGGKINVKGSTW
jgi:hypothetical protein